MSRDFRPVATAGPTSAANVGSIVSTTVGGAPRLSFTPPLFGSFGKKAKDLFKKKYEFEHQLKVLNTTADGKAIETSVVFPTDKQVRGVFKSAVPVRSLGQLNGTFESEFHTVAEKESKTSYKFSNLIKGGFVKVGITGVKADSKNDTADFPEGWATVEAEYSQEYVGGNVAVRTNGQKTLVDAVLAVGYDNLSVGGKATIDVASKQAPQDYNFGAEYAGADYVASAVTEKKRSVLSLSYFQQIAKAHTVGAQASFGLVKPSRSLQFGTDYRVDPDTTVRAFAKVEAGKDTTVLATAVEHKLYKPNVLLGVAAEFNISPSNVTAGRMGIQATLGDF